jgi:endogenous inhibitor of DNA gyrase (YacG/DUF329 family)
MVLTKKVKIKINNRYVKYYKNKGYDVKGGDEIFIKIEDIPEKSHCEIIVKCTNCGTTNTIKMYNYNFPYYCKKCKHIKTEKSVMDKYGVKTTLLLDDVKEKTKNTFLKNYGVDHYSKSNEFKNKIKKITGGLTSTLLLDDVKEKTKNTLINKYGVDHYSKSDEFKDKIKNTFLKNYGVEHYSKTEEFKQTIEDKTFERYLNKVNIKEYKDTNLKIICDICGEEYFISRDLLKNRTKYKTILCTKCNPVNSFSRSGMEIQLFNFIKNNYDGKILNSNRNIIGKELDIYLPDLNLAFEFNGLFWHNELNKSKDYHKIKTELCKENGITLIHIWEDDWIYKSNIIKKIILEELNKNEITITKFEIREIESKDKVMKFLNENHINGYIDSKINIGFYFKNKLVSIISFDEIQHNKKYELVRFCNKIGFNISNSLEKLFYYFTNNYKFSSVMLNLNRLYSINNYNRLGFNFYSNSEPNCYFIVNGLRYSKKDYEYQINNNKIPSNKKIFRIYDSGNSQLIFNI